MIPRLSRLLLLAALAGAALVALQQLPQADAARLVVIPLSSESHISAFTALTTELETLGGHEIHMVGRLRGVRV
jgi:hypothetical protein